jgi:hypothetical protein
MSQLENATVERLRQFFGSYFHQDWDIDGDSWREVLEVYFRVASPAKLRQLRDDLAALLGSVDDDDELGNYLFERLRNEYEPEEENYHQWLEQLIAAVTTRLTQQSN